MEEDHPLVEDYILLKHEIVVIAAEVVAHQMILVSTPCHSKVVMIFHWIV